MSTLTRLLTKGFIPLLLTLTICSLVVPHADAAMKGKKYSLKKMGPAGKGGAKGGATLSSPGTGSRGAAGSSKRGPTSASSIGSTGAGGGNGGTMLHRGR